MEVDFIMHPRLRDIAEEFIFSRKEFFGYMHSIQYHPPIALPVFPFCQKRFCAVDPPSLQLPAAQTHVLQVPSCIPCEIAHLVLGDSKLHRFKRSWIK